MFCMDADLARIGFMSPLDVKDYIGHLEACGLVHLENGRPIDIAVVDMRSGPVAACDWLGFRKATIAAGQSVAVCDMAGSAEVDDVSVPAGWTFERSLSHESQFVTSEEVDANLELISRDGGVEAYRDKTTGEVVYLGSMVSSPSHEEFESIKKIASRALELDALGNKARRVNDTKLGAAVYDELLTELAPALERICLHVKYCCGFAHYARGLVLRVLQLPQDAEVHFRRSLSYSPNVLNTLLELTRCPGEMDRPAEAEAFARKAVEVEPGSAAAWGNLAMVLVELRRKEDARNAIDKAISLAPEDQLNRHILEHFDAYFDKK